VKNVRGGTYCKLELNEDQKRALEIENAGSKDLCYYCKKKGHFMAQCEKKYEEEEQEEEYEYFFFRNVRGVRRGVRGRRKVQAASTHV